MDCGDKEVVKVIYLVGENGLKAFDYKQEIECLN